MIQPASVDGPFAYSAHRARLEELKKDDGKLIKDAKSEAEKAAKAFEEAETKLKGATDADKADLEKAKTEAEDQKKDKEATAAALEKELTDLQALADKQDDTANNGKDKKSGTTQVVIQLKAAGFSVIYAFVLSLGLVFLTQAITLGNFKTDEQGESEGLDRTEHGEVGFDFSAATESVTVVSTEPRAASEPRGNGRFEVQLAGVDPKELMKVWTGLCQPSETPPDKDFLAVYPHVTTVRGTTFRCRGGDPATIAKKLESLFTRHVGKGVSASAPVPLH
jgi:Skp family chaperone for outer membrane proteins